MVRSVNWIGSRCYLFHEVLPSKKSVNDGTLVYLPSLNRVQCCCILRSDCGRFEGPMVLWCQDRYVDCVQARNWAPTLSWRFSQMLGIPVYHGSRMPSQNDASQLLYKLHLAQEAVSNWVAVCRSRGTCCT